MIAWENYLPAPGWTGYGFRPLGALVRTPMEAGPDRVRRVLVTVPVEFSVPFQFTSAQCDTFWGLYRDEFRHGAEPFQIDLRTGLGMATHEIYQLTVGSLDREGANWWRARLTMRTLTRNVLTAGQSELAAQYPLSEIESVSSRLHTHLHEDLPGPFAW